MRPLPSPLASPPPDVVSAPFDSLLAELLGVAPDRLRDIPLLSGLLVAAASAAGFAAVGGPLVRPHADGGATGFLMGDGSHMTVHSFPARELLLFDVLVAPPLDARRALDVFSRRLAAREIRSGLRPRG